MRSRLFLRYWLVVAGLITAILVVGGGVEIFIAFRENVGRVAGVQRAEATLVAERIHDRVDRARKSLERLANLPWHAGVLAQETLRKELTRQMVAMPEIRELRAYGRDGAGLVRLSRVDIDAMPGAPAALEARRPGRLPTGFSPIEYREGSRPFTVLFVPVRGEGLVGQFEADIDLAFVSDLIRDMPMRSGIVYVVDGGGDVIASGDGSHLRRISAATLGHVAQARRQLADDGVWGMVSHDRAGEKIVASVAPIRDVAWHAVIEERHDHATQGAAFTAVRTGILVLAGLLAAVLVSSLLAQRLSRPIVEMRATARRIAQGDLQARIDVDTGDEVEDLARELNAMAVQLKEYTEGLEKKVEEKTGQLRAAADNAAQLLKSVERERTAAEQALQVAREAMRAKTLFLAAASHDLRQPLYAISILADTLSSQGGTLDAVALERLRQAIGVLRMMFDNLLDLSRFDAGEVRPVLRDVSLQSLLESLVAEHEVLCRAKGLEWASKIPPVFVRTDPDLARRLVGNLLANAVRYTTSGRVWLIAEQVDQNAIVVRIGDTGRGIAHADRERIFDEFVQLENPGRERERGVGLGLSIVKRIVALLDLRLELESSPGVGTTFSVELPLAARASNEPDAAEEDGMAAAAVAGLRLWVVEDDEIVRGALELQFEAMGVACSFAESRSDVLKLREMEGSWPDAAMLDDSLGTGEHGLEIATWLQDIIGADRIVVVTGNVDPLRLRAINESGFKAFRKPLVVGELRKWLLRIASLARVP